MRQRSLVAVVATSLMLTTTAGCGQSDLIPSAATASDAIPTSAPLPQAQRLAGVTGTAPITDINPEFRRRLTTIDPSISDPSFAAEAYDAVTILALATEIARTDAPTKMASEIIGVTNTGRKCGTFAQCRVLTDSGTPLDYAGQSGAIDMLPSGEPGEARYGVMRFAANGALDQLSVRSARSADLAAATAPTIADPTTGPPADGILKLGIILPRSGPDVELGRAQRAGIQLAIAEINGAGGVLGDPIETVDLDSGEAPGPVSESAVTTALSKGVDAILGAGSSLMTSSIAERVLSAGVILFSSSATAETIVKDTRGLFFRDAPSDALQGQVLAEVVAADGFLKPILVVERDLYGQLFGLQVASGLKRLGGGATATVLFDANAADYNDVVAAIKGGVADSLVFIGDDPSLSRIFDGLFAAGSITTKPPWYVGNLGPGLAVP